MTDREKAIVSAYTEICMLTGDKFQIFHKYIEDTLGRPVMTHELAFLADVIKKRSKADFIELCKDGSDSIKALKQVPCEDCISRQAALASANELKDDLPDDDHLSDMVMSHNEGVLEYQTKLSLLPPVTPQPKIGHWIRFKEFENGYYHIKCSECGQYWSIDGHAKIFRYCFNCGAKMEEVEDK